MPQSNPMRILFVKTSSLGDVVHNCPAVTDVRSSHPGATIDWVVEETFAGIVSMHSAIRKVIPVAVRRWRRSMIRPSVWNEMLMFKHSLRAERYDLIIDSQGLLKSALIAALGRGVRHGFDAASARERVACCFYDVRHAVARDLHAVERNRHLTAKTLNLSRVGACD
jgi:heptosyltransferase I